MKKHCQYYLLLCLLIGCTLRIQAQDELWGMTKDGGIDDNGVIFKINPDGTGYSLQKEFITDIRGTDPMGSLMEYNGKLYGMTSDDGFDDHGVLYEYDPANGKYTKKINVAGNAYGSLMEYNDKFYGMTYNGGANNLGVLFEYDPANGSLSTKIDFAGDANGANPFGSLTEYNGKLYGMTRYGGVNNLGVLFEYDLANGNLSKKIDFAGVSNGANPQGSLLAYNGKLYGMTRYGGATQFGVLFEYDPSSGLLTKTMNFPAASNGFAFNGTEPLGSLIEYDDKLYGMTSSGGSNYGGVLFEYDPATGTNGNLIKKMDFTGAGNGYKPWGSLVEHNGKLYGMTSDTDSFDLTSENDSGVLFEYNLADGAFSKKIGFTVSNGAAPRSSLIKYNNKLYGVTLKGGSNNRGVLFDYNPANGDFNKKVDFASTADGAFPYGSLTLAANGKLYGMTSKGGVDNMGVLFEYNPADGAFSKKIDFTGIANGSVPYGSLTLATNGKLYGMTRGGTYDHGVLFEYNPGDGFLTKKIEFQDALSGSSPSGNLTEYNGKLYGMTTYGGSNNLGVLFEYDLSSGNYIKKIDFTIPNGANPYGSLTEYKGKLYGMTTYGGPNISGPGILFEYNPGDVFFTKKIDFINSTTGIHPYGNLTEYNDKLYGMTYGGTTKGVLFEYDPSNATITKKIDFADGINNGAHPYGSLINYNGKLYGMTSMGGANNGSNLEDGVLFEYDPLNGPDGTLTKKLDFTGANGSHPSRSSLLLVKGSTPLPIILLSFTAQADGNRTKIAWSTAAEKENKTFEVERSTDGKTFSSIATVSGNQNSTQVQHYSVYDHHPANGTNYYRLVQEDNNGDKKVYDTKAVRFALEQKVAVSAFPNPTSNEINISLDNYTGKIVEVDLLDINGRSIYRETITVDPGQNNTYKLNLAKQPAAGNYMLHVRGQDLNTSLKLVVL